MGKLLGTAFSFCFLVVGSALAQIYGPNAVEVDYEYTSSFAPNYGDPRSEVGSWTGLDFVHDHANHVFGILTSEKLRQKFRLDPSVIGGLGGPRRSEDSTIRFNGRRGDKVLTYSLRGKMILHKKVAASWLRAGKATLPLPHDMSSLYRPECTDEHYTSLGDYWYFYDPFREGCEALSTEPVAQLVEVRIRPQRARRLDLNPRLDLVRGDNGNGALFLIYTVTGFEASSTDPADLGLQNFKTINRRLASLGFTDESTHLTRNRPLHIFRKTVRDRAGKEVNLEIRRLLAETGANENNLSFAKFLKEAVENADVFAYDGHSGLGANLDLGYLQSLSGPFQFRPRRRQIFFFDSCSSYSYYLTQFAAAKTNATIDVMTNGLSSLFNTAASVHNAFFDTLLDFSKDPAWPTILRNMEKPLGGSTYLLNVGAL